MAHRIFFDDFERDTGLLGTGNPGWWQEGSRPLPTIVTTAADGLIGPYSGTRMCQVNDPNATDWQTAGVDSWNYTNEMFIRTRIRLDQNLYKHSGGSPKKLMRIYFWNETNYRDIYETCIDAYGLSVGAYSGDNGTMPEIGSTYWGDAQGDNTGLQDANWHLVEYYFNHSERRVKVWHDTVLIKNDIAGSMDSSIKWNPFYLTSNWGTGAPDSTNYAYFDNFEIYSDRDNIGGDPATGSMSDRSISVGGLLDAPTGIRWRPA